MELYRTGWLDALVASAVALSVILGIAAFVWVPTLSFAMRWTYETGIASDPYGVIEYTARHYPDWLALFFGFAPVPVWVIVNWALPRDHPAPAHRVPLLLAMLGSALVSILCIVSIASWFTDIPDVPVLALAILGAALILGVLGLLVWTARVSSVAAD